MRAVLNLLPEPSRLLQPNSSRQMTNYLLHFIAGLIPNELDLDFVVVEERWDRFTVIMGSKILYNLLCQINKTTL